MNRCSIISHEGKRKRRKRVSKAKAVNMVGAERDRATLRRRKRRSRKLFKA